MVCPVLNRKQLEMGRFELKKRADQGSFLYSFPKLLDACLARNAWFDI